MRAALSATCQQRHADKRASEQASWREERANTKDICAAARHRHSFGATSRTCGAHNARALHPPYARAKRFCFARCTLPNHSHSIRFRINFPCTQVRVRARDDMQLRHSPDSMFTCRTWRQSSDMRQARKQRAHPERTPLRLCARLDSKGCATRTCFIFACKSCCRATHLTLLHHHHQNSADVPQMHITRAPRSRAHWGAKGLLPCSARARARGLRAR